VQGAVFGRKYAAHPILHEALNDDHGQALDGTRRNFKGEFSGDELHCILLYEVSSDMLPSIDWRGCRAFYRVTPLQAARPCQLLQSKLVGIFTSSFTSIRTR
jgi:hypothetical protein